MCAHGFLERKKEHSQCNIRNDVINQMINHTTGNTYLWKSLF